MEKEKTEPDEDNVLQKPKKPRTIKQVEAFEKAKQKRVEVLKIKREKIQEIKASKPEIPLKKPEPAPEPESEEDEIVVVRRKPKKKKKVIVIEDEESSEDEGPIVKPIKAKKPVVDPMPPIYNIKYV